MKKLVCTYLLPFLSSSRCFSIEAVLRHSPIFRQNHSDLSSFCCELQYPLLPKSGLLQQLCSESEEEDSSNITLVLQDIPGGEEAFELCAKFCYGITINLSAHNFVPAFCASNFLQMSEAVEKMNFVKRLEVFFSSCILEGWKDSIVTLQNTGRLFEWSENLGIVRRCIEAIVEKILSPPAKVRRTRYYI